jgi:hypothetical protein
MTFSRFDPRQSGDDVLSQSIGKALKLSIASQCLKGENSDGRTAGKGHGQRGSDLGGHSARCAGAGSVLAFAHFADEANALAEDGADQPLILAAVANRLAGGSNSACERRFGNNAPLPDVRDQVVFAGHPLAIADEVVEKISTCGSTVTRSAPRRNSCRSTSSE